MKRIQRSATPTVRALPPQRPRLVDTPGVLPTLRVAGAAIAATVVMAVASVVVLGVAQGVLAPIVVPILSLSILAATAAYMAGRNEAARQASEATGRSRAKGRLDTDAARDSARKAAAESGILEASAADLHAAAGAVLKTKFLDDISQSLRAPITSICLAARIIRKHFDTTPEVVAHFGDTLLAEADRLGQIVDEFLELARIESGLVEWEDSEVDAADLIERAVAEVEPLAVSLGVSVAFTLEPGLPPIQVDRERATQALTILLALAVRASSEGSEIVIQIAGAHGGWVFSVGGASFVFPHAEARKVNARGNGSTTLELEAKVPENAGLSLCLAREIVSRYQGRIWIEGAPGVSGCMRFTIPYKQQRRAAQPAGAAVKLDTDAPAAPAVCEVDLEERRARAAKLLEERASVRPPRAEETTSEPPATTPAPAEATAAPVANTAAATAEADGSDARATIPDVAGPAASNDRDAVETEVKVTPPKPKLSFARSEDGAAKPATTRAARPLEARAAETSNETARPPSAPASVDAAAPSFDPEPGFEDEDAAPEIIDDTPVRAPVSGTMVSAHHRTAGPPVLAQHAHPGVPALSGVQSAVTAALQGSDDLLIEIAESQSPDGRALVVSDEVRNLLSSTPGHLPAVASQQNLPSARGNYTPSRRRMVQAPWVVRSQNEDSPAADATARQPSTPPAGVEPSAARPRLSDRLAKRLGIVGESGKPRTGQGSARSDLLRSRRLG